MGLGLGLGLGLPMRVAEDIDALPAMLEPQ